MSHIQTSMQIGQLQIKSAWTSERQPEENKAAIQYGYHTCTKKFVYFFVVKVMMSWIMHQTPPHPHAWNQTWQTGTCVMVICAGFMSWVCCCTISSLKSGFQPSSLTSNPPRTNNRIGQNLSHVQLWLGRAWIGDYLTKVEWGSGFLLSQ